MTHYKFVVTKFSENTDEEFKDYGVVCADSWADAAEILEKTCIGSYIASMELEWLSDSEFAIMYCNEENKEDVWELNAF